MLPSKRKIKPEQEKLPLISLIAKKVVNTGVSETPETKGFNVKELSFCRLVSSAFWKTFTEMDSENR